MEGSAITIPGTCLDAVCGEIGFLRCFSMAYRRSVRGCKCVAFLFLGRARMSQFGVGMVFAWWRFGVDGGICLGLAMGFVVVWECWREGMLGKRNVGFV